MAIITEEDVVDAIDEENESRLDLLTDFWQVLVDEEKGSIPKLIAHTITCAKLLYSAKAYQDTLDWLDATGLTIAKTYGEESGEYEAFIENEDLENLRMNALDKNAAEEDEEGFEEETE